MLVQRQPCISYFFDRFHIFKVAAMADKRTRVMLGNLLRDGNLYAAHQKYRTTAARLLKSPAPSSFGTASKKTEAAAPLPFDDDAKKAADLLLEGARALLEKGELGGGTDLTLYLLDLWTTRGVPCSDENRKSVQTLIALVGGKGNWRKSIIDHAVACVHSAVVRRAWTDKDGCRWSASNGTAPAGDPALHAYIAQTLYKDRDYPGGEHHFLASATRDSAKSLATLLFEWYKLDPSSSSSTSASTLGRYAARGVLSYLEGSSILCATVFIESFLSLCITAYPSLLAERLPLSTWPEKTPDHDEEMLVTTLASLNFLQLLIRTCQIGAAEQQIRRQGSAQTQTVAPGKQAWDRLMRKYRQDVPWLREQEVKESLGYLGQMYMDIKPANAGGNNILGDLMSSLFGGGGGGGPPSSGAGGKAKGRGGAGVPKITQAGLD